MWIVAIGWMYVVTLMAATESTVVGGIITFFGYGVLPISLVFYLTGSWRRRGSTRKAALRSAGGTVSVTEEGSVPGADGAVGGHATGADGGRAGH